MTREHLFRYLAAAAALCTVLTADLPALAKAPDFTRKEDVVYGRKYGTALTMDVFTPKDNANGAAIVWVVSGGWFSAHEAINAGPIEEFLKRGYTVFAVVHGSQPRYTIPEIFADMNRAVRFIRYHAADYQIDPEPHRHHGRLGRRASFADAGNRGQTWAIQTPRTRSIRLRAAFRRWPASSRRPISSITASRARTPWAGAS